MQAGTSRPTPVSIDISSMVRIGIVSGALIR
jgi:hypothetical protein